MVVLDIVSKAVDFGFRRSVVRGTRSVNVLKLWHQQPPSKKMISIYYENYVDNIKSQYLA